MTADTPQQGTASLDGLWDVDDLPGTETRLPLALDRIDDARPFFARAFAELSSGPGPSELQPERLERLRALGTA